MELKELVGKHVMRGYERGSEEKGFYGDILNYVQFSLDDKTYRIYENEVDGYRSCCEDLEIVMSECSMRLPDIEVICSMVPGNNYEYNDILEVREIGGEVFMRIGTANIGDYYPYIVNEWIPEMLLCNRRCDNG